MELQDTAAAGLLNLPAEILLQIIEYLEPFSINRLLQINKKLMKLCLDEQLWKRWTFEDSAWKQALERRRRANQDASDQDVLTRGHSPTTPVSEDGDSSTTRRLMPLARYQEHQDMANWDPVFPNEEVSWYDEYMQRSGPACTNWFEIPKHIEGGQEMHMDVKGLALYSADGTGAGEKDMLAVAPLDDGSVCLWDVRGTRGRQGSIVAKSATDILFVDGPGVGNARRSKRVDAGVTECVSVNHFTNRAFFAVQSHLIEVDLARLEVVGKDSFEWSITTLSSVNNGLPLTVGTSLGIHLRDFREQGRAGEDSSDRLNEPYDVIFGEEPLPRYASLSQPTPVSILHLPHAGSHYGVTDDIYVAGRFTSILHYDRRKFPSILDSIFSGAHINSLAALPYPFSTVECEVRRYGGLATERARELRQVRGGQTVIAGGVYNQRGSLEVYGLRQAEGPQGTVTTHDSKLQNRQTAASASIMSVTSHGTKIVFSDGAGLIKWFERDGTTEVRRHHIGHSERNMAPSVFQNMRGADDFARKIVSTRSTETANLSEGGRGSDSEDHPNNDNIVFWTGDKLGMVSFTSSPLCSADDFEDEKEEDPEEEAYSRAVRDALVGQARDALAVQGFGYGQRPPA